MPKPARQASDIHCFIGRVSGWKEVNMLLLIRCLTPASMSFFDRSSVIHHHLSNYPITGFHPI